MMFHAPQLSVVLATVHVPLADVPRLLTRELVTGILRLTARSLPRFGVPAPRIALAGLNPHAGERACSAGKTTRCWRRRWPRRVRRAST
jgi:4-hydroxy-L-threonine phosphate dehydrogenase PdxA